MMGAGITDSEQLSYLNAHKEGDGNVEKSVEQMKADGDFECCAYRSKSGKTGCGTLRYYHDEPHMKKRHKFVESSPSKERIAAEKAKLWDEMVAALTEYGRIHFVMTDDHENEEERLLQNTVTPLLRRIAEIKRAEGN